MNPLKEYRGKDCVSKFCEHITAEACRLYESFPEKPMEPLTKAQLKEYNHATKCHIYFKPFRDPQRGSPTTRREGNRKVRGH